MNEDFPCHSDQRRKQTSFTSIIIYSTKQLYVAPTQDAKVLALQSDHVGVLFSKIFCRLMLMMFAVLLQKQLNLQLSLVQPFVLTNQVPVQSAGCNFK